MKNVLVFNGSPRKKGNNAKLINCFATGAESNSSRVEIVKIDEMNLNYCTGCLRCNIAGRCVQSGDDWEITVDKMDNADILVFASPVYFHHVSAQMKKLIDRFRSLVHVRITETGLNHTPVKQWDKEVVLILTMGSSDDSDAQPVIEMFRFIFGFLTSGKRLHLIKGTRLAVAHQLEMDVRKLKWLYNKLGLSGQLAIQDYEKNEKIKEACYQLGKRLTG